MLANESLLGGGGVDGAIHRAACPRLLEECRTLNGCRTGEAKMTKGYDLPAEYVIHTVGPIWRGGGRGEEKLLENCYRNCLKLFKEKDLKSIAFSAISTGVYGHPKEDAAKIAVEIILDECKDLSDDYEVYLVAFDTKAYTLYVRQNASQIKPRQLKKHVAGASRYKPTKTRSVYVCFSCNKSYLLLE